MTSSPDLDQLSRPDATDVLVWSRDAVTPALRAAVDSLPDPMRHIAGHHFGWWDDQGRPVSAASGKSLRPALVLLGARAVGGDPAAAVPAAVAVELVHNFSLLHDDVMDGDLTRRHRPTAWSVFGVNAAILAGDALLTLAFSVLASSPSSPTDGTSTLGAAVQTLLRGQSADLRFEQTADVSVDEALDMSAGKTGALIACACALGAASGHGRPDQIEHLRSFGAQAGLAFQLVDDLLGIWGAPAVTGKPVHSDLRSRKKSVPVVAALVSDTVDGDELRSLYRRSDPLSDTEVVRAAQLVDASGGRSWCRQHARDLLSSAVRDLRSASPDPAVEVELRALAQMITDREC